jgi:hypothetical protein
VCSNSVAIRISYVGARDRDPKLSRRKEPMVIPSLTKAAARTVLDCCSKTRTSQPYLVARSALSCARGYVTDSESQPRSSPNTGSSSGTNTNALPRPPPSKQPDVEAFSGPSQPGQYYERPTPRELPRAGVRFPAFLVCYVIVVVTHSCFNRENGPQFSALPSLA